MPITDYQYDKQIDVGRIIQEIQQSCIVTALDHITTVGTIDDIWFKDVLSDIDKTTLDTIVINHIPTPLSDGPREVVTQSEKRDKTLKLAYGSSAIGEDGTATILLKVPGTPGSTDGRWISNGLAFFDIHDIGDMIQSVRFTDEDNLLGGGVGTIIGSYTDDEMPPENQGWVIPPVGTIKAESIGGYGLAPAGFYIKIVGKKGGGKTTGTLYVNIEWAKSES